MTNQKNINSHMEKPKRLSGIMIVHSFLIFWKKIVHDDKARAKHGKIHVIHVVVLLSRVHINFHVTHLRGRFCCACIRNCEVIYSILCDVHFNRQFSLTKMQLRVYFDERIILRVDKLFDLFHMCRCFCTNSQSNHENKKSLT